MTMPVPKKPRDGNIELLRCLLMFIVVLHHSAVFGPLIGARQAEVVFAMTVPAVDCFVAISGWFGIKFTWNKWLRLLALVILFRGGVWLFDVGLYLVGQRPDIPPTGFGADWFAGAYLALMLVAPLLNAGLEALAQTPKRLLHVWGLFAVAMVLAWAHNACGLFDVFEVWGWKSHTLSTLAFVYVTARTARLLDWPARLGRGLYWALGGLVLFLGGYLALRLLFPNLPMGLMRGYNSPIILALAFMGLFLFLRFRVQGWLGALVRFLGPSMFGVYLIHSTTYGQDTFLVPERWLMAVCPTLPPVVVILFGAICCFTISLGIDLLRRALLVPLRPFFVHQLRP